MQSIVLAILMMGLVSCHGGRIKVASSGSIPIFEFNRLGIFDGVYGSVIDIWDTSAEILVWRIAIWDPPDRREAATKGLIMKEEALGGISPLERSTGRPEEIQERLLKALRFGTVPEGWYQIYPEKNHAPISIEEQTIYLLTFRYHYQPGNKSEHSYIFFQANGKCKQVGREELMARVTAREYLVLEATPCRFSS